MASPSRLRFDIEDAPSDADVEVLPNGLEAFNESRWPGHQQWRPLAVFAREGGRIVAGLAGETYSGWLFTRYLWVSDALRGRGIGRRLLSEARLSSVRRAGLLARPQAHLPAKAARGRDVRRERRTRWAVQFCARRNDFRRLGSLFCNSEKMTAFGRGAVRLPHGLAFL
jgi:GNAT superfamily N-acetyltransferase